MLARVDGDLELGADAVVGGNEDRVRETGGEELEARTGAECRGPLSGGGSEFYFRRVDGAWLVTDRSDWQVGANGRPILAPSVRLRDGEAAAQ